MPTVRREGAYRFYFVSHDAGEPPHIHVDRGSESAKFWLEPISLAHNRGFKPHELRELETLVVEYREEFLEAWNEFFDTQN
jgi:hypothetical protein